MSEKIVIIIQARIGSTRLPGKVLMKLQNKTVIEQIIDRLKFSKYVDNIIIATSTGKLDDTIYELCIKNQIECFRGSETDVLDRYYQCAKGLGLNKDDNIIRITGDCPLIDYEIMDKVIEKHRNTNADYTCNIINPTYPDGLDVEIIKMEALEKSWYNAQFDFEREHVTQYIQRHPEIFNIQEVKNDIDLSSKRWTLDEKEDYQLIQIIYASLYQEKGVFLMQDILGFLEKNTEYEQLNKKHMRNENLQKSVKQETEG